SGVSQSESRGYPHQHSLWDVPIVLQRPWRVDSDEVQLVTDVRVTAHARRTSTAPVEGYHYHLIARRPVRYVFAYDNDGAGHLVSQDRGSRHPRIHVAIVDVQIGSADTRIGHPQLNLTTTRGSPLDVANDYSVIAFIVCREHSHSPFNCSCDRRQKHWTAPRPTPVRSECASGPTV